MDAYTISFDDRRRLSDELNRLPAWLYGGVTGEKGVLLAAGLPEQWVHSHPLTGVPKIDSEIVITNLQSLGHLEDRPTYYALGTLAEYLLNNTPHIEGKLFLAYLLYHYQLITSLDYLGELQAKYALLEAPILADLLDLGWDMEQPPFSWQGPTNPDQLEAIWRSRASFLDAVFLEKGARVARAICRVEKAEDLPLGTGFLIGPDLVLTNHHVVPADDEAEATQVRFGYRVDHTGQLKKGEAYQVKCTLRRSPMKELDYVVLQIEDSPGEHDEIGYLRPVPKKLETGRSTFIIQHPYGNPQKVVLQDNWITYVATDQRRVQYLTNTEHGSSGSPVCNESWEVVALHHSGRPVPASTKAKNLRGNEGIPMIAILPEIQDLLP